MNIRSFDRVVPTGWLRAVWTGPAPWDWEEGARMGVWEDIAHAAMERTPRVYSGVLMTMLRPTRLVVFTLQPLYLEYAAYALGAAAAGADGCVARWPLAAGMYTWPGLWNKR